MPIASFKTVCKMRGVLSDESFPSSAAADSSSALRKPDTLEFLTKIQMISGEALFEDAIERDMDTVEEAIDVVGGVEEGIGIRPPIIFAVPNPPDRAPSDPVFVHPTNVQRPDLSKLTLKQSLKMSFKKLLHVSRLR